MVVSSRKCPRTGRCSLLCTKQRAGGYTFFPFTIPSRQSGHAQEPPSPSDLVSLLWLEQRTRCVGRLLAQPVSGPARLPPAGEDRRWLPENRLWRSVWAGRVVTRTAALLLSALVLGTACATEAPRVLAGAERKAEAETTAAATTAAPAKPEDRWLKPRTSMVREQISHPTDGRPAVTDAKVIEALQKVPRHLFVPQPWRERAYQDSPLPIGFEQTISQPYIVAIMTQLLAPGAEHVVLEVGTGSGYQAAVLGELVREVYTIEIVEPLAARAAKDLQAAGYRNVHVRAGDGYLGWPEHAPFDSIIVTAAPDHVPAPLVQQLKVGGRLVIPVGPQGWQGQELVVLEKQADGSTRRSEVMPVRFVPLTRNPEDDAPGSAPR